jgi:hypothetical protein
MPGFRGSNEVDKFLWCDLVEFDCGDELFPQFREIQNGEDVDADWDEGVEMVHEIGVVWGFNDEQINRKAEGNQNVILESGGICDNVHWVDEL